MASVHLTLTGNPGVSYDRPISLTSRLTPVMSWTSCSLPTLQVICQWHFPIAEQLVTVILLSVMRPSARAAPAPPTSSPASRTATAKAGETGRTTATTVRCLMGPSL